MSRSRWWIPPQRLPRVVLTPHTGGHTNEAVKNMGAMAVQNCIDVLSGKGSKYILNK